MWSLNMYELLFVDSVTVRCVSRVYNSACLSRTTDFYISNTNDLKSRYALLFYRVMDEETGSKEIKV